MSTSVSRKLTILALCAAFTGCAESRPTPVTAEHAAAGSASPTVLTLEPYGPNLKVIQVRVGGQTRPFILDTGGGTTLVTPEVAKAAGCTPFGRLSGFRAVGERLDSQRCGPLTLALGATGPAVTPGEVAVFDLTPLLGGGPPVGGLVTLNAFEGQAITLDLAGERLILETPASLARRTRNLRPLTVRAARQAGGASLDLMLAVETPQGLIWLEADSGNAGPVQISPHALRQMGIEIPQGTRQKITLNVAGLGPVEVEAMERDLIYDGLLNAAFLKNLVLTVDLGSMKAWAAVKNKEG